MAYFMTRSEHDHLLDTNPGLLREAFDTCESRQWFLAGVEFHGLSEGLTERIVDATDPGQPDEGPEFPLGEFNPNFIY